jgi:hypothetical protein
MRTPPKLLIVVLAATAATSACRRGGGAPPPQPQPQPPEPFPPPARVYYDNGGGIQDSLRMVVKDAETLNAVWERATSRQASPPPAPTVDFGREMLVVVGAGRMTPDDQIRVDSAYVTREMDSAGRMEEMLNVLVRTIAGCRRFNADAYPLDIVRMRRFDGPIRFVERSAQTEGCRNADPPEPDR